MEATNRLVRPAGLSSDLDGVVAAAVAEGLKAVDGLTKMVMSAFDDCLSQGDYASLKHGDLPGREVIDSYNSLLMSRRGEAGARFTRQRTRLETFNLVLFGRTGAGKSSLIEALSGDHGEPISQGESDWTVDVRDVYWRSTRLVDTPGIAGWGRTVARADLEARAEAAVADADVVILCFDSQSQQAGEFSKIAEWISRYGKPVVAVLNSRNPRWRNPARVPSEVVRRNLSRTVHEHVEHIRDELSRIGPPMSRSSPSTANGLRSPVRATPMRVQTPTAARSSATSMGLSACSNGRTWGRWRTSSPKHWRAMLHRFGLACSTSRREVCWPLPTRRCSLNATRPSCSPSNSSAA